MGNIAVATANANVSNGIGLAGLLVSLFACMREAWRTDNGNRDARLPHNPSTMTTSNQADKPARCWCFTWNNPPDDHAEKIKELFDDEEKGIQYIVYGKETGDSGTFHLQGFLQTKEDAGVAALRDGGPASKFFQAHWTKARSIKASIEYCKKDGDVTELGEYQGRKPGGKQGKRSDLHEFKEAVKAAQASGEYMTHKRAREEYSDVYSKYARFCELYIADCRPTPEIAEHPLYPWQRGLEHHLLHDEPCDREVIFVVDRPGNSGKSWFSKRFSRDNPTAQLMTPGKMADMSYALDESTTVLLIDCPRSRYELFQYDFCEYVKNGHVFSTKYESRVKRLGKCHVVVFMNQLPDDTKLSIDRYTIIEINPALLDVDHPDTRHIRDWQSLRDYQERTGIGQMTRRTGMAPGFFPGAHQGF